MWDEDDGSPSRLPPSFRLNNLKHSVSGPAAGHPRGRGGPLPAPLGPPHPPPPGRLRPPRPRVPPLDGLVRSQGWVVFIPTFCQIYIISKALDFERGGGVLTEGVEAQDF